MLDELNDMMGKYKESNESRNQMFEQRKQNMIDKAKEMNNETLKLNILNKKTA